MTNTNNQPYNPQSDNRMYVQPNYPNQPQYPNSPQQQAQSFGTLCPVCNQLTNSYVKKAIGGITWVWFCMLLLFTGILCWIPFVCDSCKEEQIVCAQCHTKKVTL